MYGSIRYKMDPRYKFITRNNKKCKLVEPSLTIFCPHLIAELWIKAKSDLFYKLKVSTRRLAFCAPLVLIMRTGKYRM